jgi:hypothetical protein
MPIAKTSVLAIVSLVLGVLGFCTGGLLGVVGVILGIAAIVQINRSAGLLQGNGVAIAGIIVGSVSLVSACFMIGLLLPALGKAREAARSSHAVVQLKHLAMSASMYAAEHEGIYPPADAWEQALDPYVGDIEWALTWPGRDDQGPAFAMNVHMAGRSEPLSGEPCVLFFEVDPGSPSVGGPELLARQPRSPRSVSERSERAAMIVLTDNSVHYITPEEAEQFRWKP